MDKKRREILKFMLGSLAGLVNLKTLPSEAHSSISNESQFINLCNLAISHEYGAIIQYINHSGIIQKREIWSVLLENMNDEVVHARELTRILIKEGATPTVAAWPPQTGKRLIHLLKEDIAGENAAIELYQQILDLPESSSYRDVIYPFLKREMVHRERLQRLINALSPKG